MIRKSSALCGQYKVWLAIFVVAGQWILPIENARILAVETTGSYSRWNFMNAVLQSLTDAGHSVTAFTPFADGDRENYTAVDTSDEIHRILEWNMTYLLDHFSRPFALARMRTGSHRSQCDVILGNRRLQELMAACRDGGKADFDAIVVEPMEYDCVSHLANAMRLPIIYVISSPMISSTERTFTGHLSNSAVVPHMFGRQGVPKTFVQRFGNTVLLAYSLFVSTCQERIARFTDPKPFDLSPTVNPSIIFQNSHYITETPSPTVPNLIHIGGIHMKPVKSIPQDILDFIEDSPQGIIIFSFGSVVKSSSLPVHIEKAFKEALVQVPLKVLWKYEGEMEDKPNNVMIKKWFPQRDVLLHPKIKLFIGHGGMSGVYEAVDAGVPVLGFPLFFDQPRNIDHLVHNEMAISMDLSSITKDSLLTSILELVNNKKYAKNAEVASLRFKDRPMSPQQLVVYWTEYVIRHGGAPHLRSFAHNLTWYQYFLLDIIGVMFIFIFIIVYIVYTILKVTYTLTLNYSRNIKVKSQ